MANELTWDTVTGLTINAYRFKTDDNVFLANPASNEVWGTSGRTAADYAIAMSESGSSGHYSVDFNDGGAIAAGVYRLVYAIQAGVSPANSDRKIAKAEIDWDGSAEITKSVIETVVDTIAGDVVNIDGIVPAAAGDAMTLVADQAVNVTKIAGATVNTAAAQIGVNVVSEDNIDFGAAKKTSLNAATPDLTAITSDKNSYKATGFATPTNVSDAHTITDAKIDVTDGKIDGLNNITVADILAGVIEGTITLQQSLRGLMSVNFHKASGGDTTSIKFRNLADTKNRITETVDANGNRTSVTLDLT